MLCTLKNGTVESLILTLNIFKRVFFSILFDMVLRTVMQKLCKVWRLMLRNSAWYGVSCCRDSAGFNGPSVQKFCTPWRPVLQKLCTPWRPVLLKFYTPWRLELQKFCTLWRPALQKFRSPRRPALRRRRGHLKPNCKDSALIVFEEMATPVPVL